MTRLMIAYAAVFALVAVGAAPHIADAQSKPQNVTVVNPSTNPVNTNIINSVVPVEVSNADPIPVAVTPESVEPIYAFGTGAVNVGQDDGRCSQFYAVPAGKRLIVEQVSVWASSGEVDRINRVFIFATKGNESNSIDLFGQLLPSGTAFISSQQISLYADAGSSISAGIWRSGATSSFTAIQCAVIGRLVNVP